VAATIDAFTAGLDRIPRAEFTLERVQAYLEATPVRPESLAPYENFEKTHYTRNLIHRSGHYELMAICWERGQGSAIHNHHGQRCWMAVPLGRLVIQNYRIVAGDEASGRCQIEETDHALMDPAHPAHVKPEAPIHAVLNPAGHGGRALSLHVYSLPYDRCIVYSKEERRCHEVPLFFDTEYGRPVAAR
jgi:cysteine dioxygenase